MSAPLRHALALALPTTLLWVAVWIGWPPRFDGASRLLTGLGPILACFLGITFVVNRAWRRPRALSRALVESALIATAALLLGGAIQLALDAWVFGTHRPAGGVGCGGPGEPCCPDRLDWLGCRSPARHYFQKGLLDLLLLSLVQVPFATASGVLLGGRRAAASTTSEPQ